MNGKWELKEEYKLQADAGNSKGAAPAQDESEGEGREDDDDDKELFEDV